MLMVYVWGFQGLPDVMDVEVAPNGTWRPANGRYPWSKITDPLPEPLPETQQVQIHLKSCPPNGVPALYDAKTDFARQAVATINVC